MISGLPRFCRRAALVLAFGFSAMGSAVAADKSWPVSVAANYRLAFNGFDVGTYQFQSQFDGKQFAASSSADVSALFGAFRWKGSLASRGQINGSGPEPGSYQMAFKAKSKEGSVALSFAKGSVTSVSVLPVKPPHPDAVPVKPEQLKGVVDPISAILTMSHAPNGRPCDKTVPVFDGKVRFDLVMSYKGTERIDERKPSGQPAQATVCKVKYKPIAGHKPKDFVNPWVGYDTIEVALRQIPAANVYVPTRIVVPTTIGSAVMSVENVTITSADNVQIALSK